MKIAVWGGQIFDNQLDIEKEIRSLVEKITAQDKRADFYFFENNRFDDIALKVIKSLNPQFKAIYVTIDMRPYGFKNERKALLSRGYDKVILFKGEFNSPYAYRMKKKHIRQILNECGSVIYYFYPELDFERVRTIIKTKGKNFSLYTLSFEETRIKIDNAKAVLTEEELTVMENVLRGISFAALGREMGVSANHITAVFARGTSRLRLSLIRSRVKI